MWARFVHADSGTYCCRSLQVEEALWTIFSFFAVQRAFYCCCYPCIILLQAKVKAGEDPLPENADLILIDEHEESLSTDGWVDLLHSLMQVRTRALILIRVQPRALGGFVRSRKVTNGIAVYGE